MSPAPALVALALALGCAEAEVAPVARAVPGGVTVEASAPILRVRLSDGAGVPLGARTLPEPLPHATLPARWRAGEALSAEVQTQGRTWKVPVEVPETSPFIRSSGAKPPMAVFWAPMKQRSFCTPRAPLLGRKSCR